MGYSLFNQFNIENTVVVITVLIILIILLTNIIFYDIMYMILFSCIIVNMVILIIFIILTTIIINNIMATTISSREAQSNFAEFIYKVMKEPVIIQKHGKPVAVLISPEDFDKFQKLEELYWNLKVEAAEKNGYLPTAESEDFLNNILKG